MPQERRSPAEDHTQARRRWMGVLARADGGMLEAIYDGLADRPRHTLLRAPETGLVMVQGRAGGSGGRFNLGEMTVTRCSVRLADGTVGHAYVAGRDHRHAELAAVFDALLLDDGRHDALAQTVVEPLAEAQAERRRLAGRKAAATRVDFFTMVRGEDAA